MQYRKRAIEVHAVQLSTDISVNTLEGVEQAAVGDWIVIGGGGESWPVKDDIFRSKYQPVPGRPGVFATIPVVVNAEQMPQPFTLETAWGTQSGNGMDWVITDAFGDRYICSNEAFQRSYEPLDPQGTN